MQIQAIPEGLVQALDAATRGKLQEIRTLCDSRGWTLDISCVTYLNGLPDKDMKLYVTAFDEDETKLFIQAPLVGAARALGWNLYLEEKVKGVREGLREAVKKIDQAVMAG